MKVNIKKLNKIFNSEDDALKTMVIPLLNKLFEDDEYDNDFDFLFYGFGFYDLETDECIEPDDVILNAPLLLTLNSELRHIIFKNLYKNLYKDDFSETFEEFLKDSKVVIPYSKWKKEERKYKLKNLNEE